MLSQRVLPLTVRPRPGTSTAASSAMAASASADAQALPDCRRRLQHQPGAGEADRHGTELAPEEIERAAVVALGQRHGRRCDHDQPDPEQRAHREHQHEVEVRAVAPSRSGASRRCAHRAPPMDSANTTCAFTWPLPSRLRQTRARGARSCETCRGCCTRAPAAPCDPAARSRRARATASGSVSTISTVAGAGDLPRDLLAIPADQDRQRHRGRAALRRVRRMPVPCRRRRRSAPAGRARRAMLVTAAATLVALESSIQVTPSIVGDDLHPVRQSAERAQRRQHPRQSRAGRVTERERGQRVGNIVTAAGAEIASPASAASSPNASHSPRASRTTPKWPSCGTAEAEADHGACPAAPAGQAPARRGSRWRSRSAHRCAPSRRRRPPCCRACRGGPAPR